MSDAPPPFRIFLLRHARAASPTTGMRDFDRTLDQQGIEEAGRIGRAMAAKGYVPARILCSSARRCVETWEIVRQHVPTDDVLITDTLYANDHHVYVDLIREQEIRSVMVVGHNPMMDDTARRLLGEHRGSEAAALTRGFPTAGLAVIDLDTPLAQAGPASARLAGFLTPRDA